MDILLVGITSQCQALGAQLAVFGHSVICHDGKMGPSALRKPDMVLLEPAACEHRWDYCRQFRQAWADDFVPVLLLLDEEELGQGLASLKDGQADDFLLKPVPPGLLEGRLVFWQRSLDAYREATRYQQCMSNYRARLRNEQQVIKTIFARFTPRLDALPILHHFQYHAVPFQGNLCLAVHNPAGGVNMLLGDFPGQGVEAMVGVLPIAEAFYRMSDKGYGIEDMLPELNAKLQQLLPGRQGLAACLLQLEADCHSLRLWNGGMPEVLILPPGEGKPQALAGHDQRLGEVDFTDLDSKPERIDIEPHSRILIHSAGLRALPQGEVFIERLLAPASMDGALEQLADIVRRCDENDCLLDDVSFLLLDCDPERLAELEEGLEAAGGREQKQASHWELELVLGHDTLRKIGPVPVLLQLVMEVQGLDSHREALFTILSELFNNALDHGVLGLDSRLKQDVGGFVQYYQQREQRLENLTEGEVRLRLRHEPTGNGGSLEIIIEDTGPGFDYAQTLQVRDDDPVYSGRGLGLVRALCSELQYLGKGNKVRAVYCWQQA